MHRGSILLLAFGSLPPVIVQNCPSPPDTRRYFLAHGLQTPPQSHFLTLIGRADLEGIHMYT
jgi:hypothetical protein